MSSGDFLTENNKKAKLHYISGTKCSFIYNTKTKEKALFWLGFACEGKKTHKNKTKTSEE